MTISKRVAALEAATLPQQWEKAIRERLTLDEWPLLMSLLFFELAGAVLPIPTAIYEEMEALLKPELEAAELIDEPDSERTREQELINYCAMSWLIFEGMQKEFLQPNARALYIAFVRVWLEEVEPLTANLSDKQTGELLHRMAFHLWAESNETLSDDQVCAILDGCLKMVRDAVAALPLDVKP
jgi:hypothetical protein